MKLVIHSHWHNERWEGEIPDPRDEFGWTRTLDYVFRFFNRVDEDDNAKLEAIGYRLPSLSINDEVEIEDNRWRCVAIGWERIPKQEG